ncbi:MAG: protein phosphatase 2C domain-containing protein [Candidatus Uhrbacteria bacterium]
MGEKPFSEIPTIPAPRNPFEVREDEPKVFAVSIPKNEKQPNEDSILELVDPDGNGVTALVADGLGGYPGGEVASAIVRDVVAKTNDEFRRIQKNRLEVRDVAAGLEKEMELMKKLVRMIHAQVVVQRDAQPEHAHMASTGVITRSVKMLDKRWMVVGASVGDSRAYIQQTDGRLDALTLDSHPLLHQTRDIIGVGQEGALRIQSTLDELESSQQFDYLLSVLEKDAVWPEYIAILREDVEYLRDIVGVKLVKEYFDGDEAIGQRKHSFYYRNMVVSSFGYSPRADFFEAELPPGTKLVLASDGVEGLTRQEQAAVLRGDMEAYMGIDLVLAHEASSGGNSAERLAFAGVARADYSSISPRTKGKDDISVIVIEIPKR